MFQNLFTSQKVIDYLDKMKKFQDALDEADAVIIEAGV